MRIQVISADQGGTSVRMSFKVVLMLTIFLGLELSAVSHARSLPSFNALKSVYPGYSRYGGRYTSPQIKAEIGGNVNARYIDNTCAVRMSRALNKVGGHSITSRQWDSYEIRYDSVRGGDGKQYVFRVTGLARYLTETYGAPAVHSRFRSSFIGKKGIMRLNIPGSSSYTGHFALWDGNRFYQSANYISRATDMWLWKTSETSGGGGGGGVGGGGGGGGGRGRGRGGGCFPSHARVLDSNKGTISISDVQVGDKLLSLTDQGKLQYSDVIGWLHRDAERAAEFYEITTANGKMITLSGDHIIFKANPGFSAGTHTAFASAIQVGDHVLIKPNELKTSGFLAVASQVSNITTTWLTGVYAPLTREGTIVVDQIVASCYAAVDDHHLAHAALFPVRAVDSLVPGVFAEGSGYLENYLDVLQYTARLLMDKKRFHNTFHQPSVKL